MPDPEVRAADQGLIARLLHAAHGPIQIRPGEPAATCMAGESRAMHEVFRMLAQATASDAPVLITGPPGSGKSLAAWLLHRHAHCSDQPFRTIDFRPLPAVDVAVLAGHDVPTGTLVIDGVHLLPAVEVALLLERPHGRLVLLADTDADGLPDPQWVTRVAALQTIALPPLRSRPEDLAPISACLLQRLADRLARSFVLSPEAMGELVGHDWPGNVRELNECLAWAARLAVGGTILPEHLGLRARGSARAVPPLCELADQLLGQEAGTVYARWQDALDAVLLSRALVRTRGNQLQAAALLGIHRTTVRKRCRTLGLCTAGERSAPPAL